jgi:gamma-glutamyltranspeptidase / glutathione hydrolase
VTRAQLFPRACVASPHYLASSAGLSTLASGGNAVDAAVATNLTLGVVTPYLCGYGGDLFAMVWRDGIHAYNGSGRAPAAATPDAVTAAAASDELPASGPLTVTTPGAVEGWFVLLEHFGTKSFAELAQPALRYARDGFPLREGLPAYFRRLGEQSSEPWSDAWKEIYANLDGDWLVQSQLARTIETICADGPSAFYKGPIAEAIGEAIRSNGGLLEASDLAEHSGQWTHTLSSTYVDVEVVEMPPNTQGVALLEALNVVEQLEGLDERDREHMLIESMKLALADRDAYLTDPDHMNIDAAEIAGKDWARRRAAEVDPTRASSPRPGRPATGGTAYMCAADSDGLLVSLIQSNYQGFGSGVTVPGWGINLQNRGSYFSLDSSHPNVIAPRKRTLHTLMPAMALRDGRPWLVFGTMGGDGQAQTQLQILTHLIDHGLDIHEAIDAPRWMVTPGDWSVLAQSALGGEVLDDLRDRGHEVEEAGPRDTRLGHAHAIELRAGGYAAATDPRADGAALGL